MTTTPTDEARAEALLRDLDGWGDDVIYDDTREADRARIVALIADVRRDTLTQVAQKARETAAELEGYAMSTGEHDLSGAHLRDLADWCEGQEPRR
jgi:hypothetical protein